ncbi:MAG: DNA cytosine methyltransferase [Proteobacteria bacterium]|nr:DNA cytosine methyltransferase [Pseudomonadota bacterium]MBU4470261.1 DNA cytosine methyltransferase [Pseudomonadota bacterium]MCG2752675.1 DNA cytosine methyltransferase [Desulfobacteraceae bacterium]
MNEIIIDLFAGGGGASEGIRWALGRDPEVAINHDPVAIAMHRVNHPGTWHLTTDIWAVPPRWASRNKPVGLLWASPDCKHFSKAKGSAPIRSKEIRSLAWVVEKWAREARPRVIILENVEEFTTWGPLNSEGNIIKAHSGDTFRAFVKRLQRLGYRVEHRILKACDFGAPTIRKRLFMIARCDGQPITWPEPSHGPGLIPYRTAAEIIDWSLPCPSIFDRKKPLAENTLRRIAEGIRRYVIEAAEPFIVTYYGSKKLGDFRGSGMNVPLRTQTTENRFGLVVPHIQRQFGQGIGTPIDEPIGTVTAGGMGKSALVSAFLAKHYTGVVGQKLNVPIGTVTSVDHHSLVTSHLLKLRGTSKAGQPTDAPMPTVTAGGLHVGEVRAFLVKYYCKGGGQKVNDPLHTIPTKDKLGLITVKIHGESYIITDIGMRMLQPRELFRAQGFTDDYKIDISINGKKITKTEQVRCCGNSVCPPMAESLVSANIESHNFISSLAV